MCITIKAKKPVRDSLFWSNFLYVCVGAWRHWLTDRLGTTVAMETVAPQGWLLRSYVLLYQQSEQSTASVWDVKLRGHVRSDELNFIWLKATCATTRNSYDITSTSNSLNERYTSRL